MTIVSSVYPMIQKTNEMALPILQDAVPSSPILSKTRRVEDMLLSANSYMQKFLENVLSVDMIWQLIAVFIAFAFGWMASRHPQKRFHNLATARSQRDILYNIYSALSASLWPVFSVVFIWGFLFLFRVLDIPTHTLRVIVGLVNAWIVVRLLTKNMKSGTFKTFVALFAWGIAALYILRLLQPLITTLDQAGFNVGNTRISIFQVLASIVFAFAALWIGRVAGDAAQAHLKSSPRLTPSMAGLLGQVAKIAFMVLSLVIALSMVGIQMSSFAFLGGAIGVGIGFGLQSIFSNFISGIIILFERSIKVGDFIELQSGVRGEVKEINIRSTLVTTNDTVDILIPNEEFIKAQVINWTLRDPRRRLRIPFGVAYGTDKEIVKKAALEAAQAVEWTEHHDPSRAPAVWLTEFGDSSLNYELVVWLNSTAVKKPARVHADYNWALHSALEKYGLEIPFPQRDLNIRQPAELSVRIAKD